MMWNCDGVQLTMSDVNAVYILTDNL